MKENCPCGNELSYEECCAPYHEKTKKPETAETLMRARYSAFTKNKIDFIAETHEPGTTDFDIEEARAWATDSTWKGLHIVSTQAGGADQKEGVVEFKAVYADKEGKDYLHHEISSFKNIDDTWYYVDGQMVGSGPIVRATPKVGRNEPCTCGSGKKYKKCCGA